MAPWLKARALRLEGRAPQREKRNPLEGRAPRDRFFLPFLAAFAVILSGCATCGRGPSKPFQVSRDSFAYPNELLRTYVFHPDGRTTSHDTRPKPDYALHCVPMARAAREFFYHARFDPALPKCSAAEYRDLVRQVIGRDSRCPSPDFERILIPGFPSLAEFSAAFAELLKAECGGAWRSYTQRGNWRMIMRFSRAHQGRAAESLAASLAEERLPIVHLVDFPRLKINHTVLLIRAERRPEGLLFEAYDPNQPARPALLRFDAASRQFLFEASHYFRGGPVNVYEVHKNAIY